MTGYVVDASVAVKWLVSETYSEEAASLLDNRTMLIAPELLFAEASRLTYEAAGFRAGASPMPNHSPLRAPVETLDGSRGAVDRTNIHIIEVMFLDLRLAFFVAPLLRCRKRSLSHWKHLIGPEYEHRLASDDGRVRREHDSPGLASRHALDSQP